MTLWTGYLDVRILHSRWISSVTKMLQEKARAHFEKQALESQGTFANGFNATDVYRRVCVPYIEGETGEGVVTSGCMCACL